MNITLFQTLEDRNNPEEIEAHGPYKCLRKDAWLGFGYYFWDTFVEFGHKWGQYAYEEYVICQAEGILDHTCWDLHGNIAHLVEFEGICQELFEAKFVKKEKLLVAHVIEFLKKKNSFLYEAIRAWAIGSFKDIRSKVLGDPKVKFKHSSIAYLYTKPAVQLCLIQKQALSLHNYHIIYPDHYIENDFV